MERFNKRHARSPLVIVRLALSTTFSFLLDQSTIDDMSLSPTQDVLERIDRLQLALASDLPTLSPTVPQPPMMILSRNGLNAVDPLLTHHLPTSTCHSTAKSETVIIDELQRYIQKLEREREVLLKSYATILQLLKHDDLNDQSQLLDLDDSVL